MIKYNLKCHNNHEFESWFSNSDEFDKLNNKNLLECIYCPSKNIKKSIMAPMISNYKKNSEHLDQVNESFRLEKKKSLTNKKFCRKKF